LMFGFRKTSTPYKFLKYLLLANGLIVLGSFSPVGASRMVKDIIYLYFKNRKFQRNRFLEDLRRLQNRELIDYKISADGKINIVVKKREELKKLIYDFDDLKLNDRRWDKKWRLVVFDVPELSKRQRDALRMKLKKLNFYMIQKSVYITPYPCEDEIDFLCNIFDINRNNVLIFIIDKFEGEEKLKYHFKLEQLI